ncbi:hypothetical protein [uncultured Methanobrevibacter sp.]|jgi:hypothetical protein|uniref:hypothetical protein n=1 Tax=uncultured Methanobrevibacter sp. TaxID=253161 RepID=UPI0025F5BC36|nr:hypothetical protein [uncultured Methanobrevibacter sp.]
MNVRSLKLIREVMTNSGILTSVEISQDSIYLEFKDVELGVPKESEDFPLIVRFASESFFTVFYNNIWDIDFLAKYNFKNQLLSEEVLYDVVEVKFIDFEYLNTFFYNYKKEKTISVVEDFDIHNIRNDFFMLIETKEIAIVVGGNQMDFFTKFERLDDDSLRELSNQWMLSFLKYHLKRNIIKNPIYENHPLMYTKK